MTHFKAKQNIQPTGVVTLLGAGPGDPELMTVKGMKALANCDVLVYDRLANKIFLQETPAHCQHIYVGKRKCHHAVPQDEINAMLVTLAQQGKNIVRLKGGDNFIFGRGGEEIDALAKEGVACNVIPGITAAMGCAATTQIPLTHREHAHAVVFITAHRQHGELDINWNLVTQPDATVVFYMGLSNLSSICQQLIERGVNPQMPMAVIANGTGSQQFTLASTVAELPALAEQVDIPSPALLIKGDVIKASHAISQQAPLEQEFVAVSA